MNGVLIGINDMFGRYCGLRLVSYGERDLFICGCISFVLGILECMNNVIII